MVNFKDYKFSLIGSFILSFGLGSIWLFNFPLYSIQKYPIVNVFQSPGYFVLSKFGLYEYRSPTLSYVISVIFISFLVYLAIFVCLTLMLRKLKQSKDYSTETIFMIFAWILFLLSFAYLYTCRLDDLTGLYCYIPSVLSLILAISSTLGILIASLFKKSKNS